MRIKTNAALERHIEAAGLPKEDAGIHNLDDPRNNLISHAADIEADIKADVAAPADIRAAITAAEVQVNPKMMDWY